MKCAICGKIITRGAGYFQCSKDQVVCSSKCGEEYRLCRVYENQEDYYIINHVCYTIGDEDDKYKGCGGAKFRIRMLDANGAMLETTNLWQGASIPMHWQSRIPDNAEFVSVNGELME